MKILMMVLPLVAVPALAAELKQVRVLPGEARHISPALKRQYEYDPEIGKVGTAAAKLQSVTMADGKAYPAWGYVYTGDGGTVTRLPIYHGFAALQSYQAPDQIQNCGTKDSLTANTKVVLSKTSPWPAPVFKVYSEELYSRQPLDCVTQWTKSYPTEPVVIQTKKLTECRQLRSGPARELSAKLAGKLYEYNCKSFTLGSYEGAKMTPTADATVVYSDYLDTVVSGKLHNVPGVDFDYTAQPAQRLSYTFLDEAGTRQTLEVSSQFGWGIP